jgi:hypothetical protein
MRNILFVLFLLVSSQSISQQTISPSGGNITGIKENLSFTIGEVFYDNKGNSKDGIQQGFKLIYKPLYSSLQLSLYPNPTTELLYFNVGDNDYENLHYQIFDFVGQILESGMLSQKQNWISLKKFPSQDLLIQFYRNAYEHISYKVLKID